MSFSVKARQKETWVYQGSNIHFYSDFTPPPLLTPADDKPLEFGMLTRTVVDSPIIRHIIHARIRSEAHADILYIGDDFVTVSELRGDGNVYEIIRKSDFDSRILHVGLLGQFFESEAHPLWEDDRRPKPSKVPCAARIDIETVDDDGIPLGQGILPPQILVLVLESQQIVFLFLASRGSSVEFCSSRYSLKPAGSQHIDFREMDYTQIMQFTVDPLSRYMAVSFAICGFCVYELENRDALEHQFKTTGRITPVRSYRAKFTHDIVLKLAFLFPHHNTTDSVMLNMVVLVLALVRNGETRITAYDWQDRADLKGVLAKGKKLHKVPTEYELPLFMVPLGLNSNLLLITESVLTVCSGLSHGMISFCDIPLPDCPPSDWYHGHGRPLWTSYSRPTRTSKFSSEHDLIYVAREDGVVIYIEFDGNENAAAAIEMGDATLETSVDTAFCVVPAYRFDAIFIGGDCGNGSVWIVNPRQSAVRTNVLQNWVPSLDIVSSDGSPSWNDKHMIPWSRSPIMSDVATPSSKLYTASCRGTNGAIFEHRVGIRANILQTYEVSRVEQTWIFPVEIASQHPQVTFDTRPMMPKPTHFYILSSSRYRSDVLLVTHHSETRHRVLTKLEDLLFEFEVETLACGYKNCPCPDNNCSDPLPVYQLTADDLVMFKGSEKVTVPIPTITNIDHSVAENGSFGCDILAFTVCSGNLFTCYLLDFNDLVYNSRGRIISDGEITYLHINTIAGIKHLFLGIRRNDGTSSIALYNIDDSSSWCQPCAEFKICHDEMAEFNSSEPIDIEPFKSLTKVFESERSIAIMGGTRAGFIVTLTLNKSSLTCVSMSLRRLGNLPVALAVVLPLCSDSGATSKSIMSPRVLATSDDSVVVLEDFIERANGKGDFCRTTRVLTTTMERLSAPLPEVFGLTVVPHGWPSRCSENPGVLMITEKELLFTDLETAARPVPRQLSTNGSPKHVLYSQKLECLVTSVINEGRPFLKFIDPKDATDLTYPTSRNGQSRSLFIDGLGEVGERILCLKEWLYTKDGKSWLFYLIGTYRNRLLIVSAVKEGDPINPSRKRIRCWLRHKVESVSGPIWNVYTVGDNVFYSTGMCINWAQISLAERKLVTQASSELKSQTVSIEAYRDKIAIMTCDHSLFVITYGLNPQGVPEMKLDNMDPKSMLGSDMIHIGPDDDHPCHLPITLFSDREKSVSGNWIPPTHNQDIHTLFDITLHSSIRKFCRGKTNPPWCHNWTKPRFGRVPSTIDDAEIFGITLNGIIEHFTMLDLKAWRFLVLVQRMAEQSELICPYSYEGFASRSYATVSDMRPVLDRLTLHVDGNKLKRCLDKKALEHCFNTEISVQLMKELLDDLDTDRYWVREIDAEIDENVRHRLYFELAYDVLEYFLRPVL